MSVSITKATKEFPFHVSVGAVLTNDEGLICVHFYKKDDLPIETEKKSDLWLLMRESIESGEALETTVLRGLKEEFGAAGEVKAYLGSIKSHFPLRVSKVEVEKTTLYFHVKMTSLDPESRDKDEVESKSEIKWIAPETLENIFVEQGKKYGRSDLDESSIIRNYLKYVRN